MILHFREKFFISFIIYLIVNDSLSLKLLELQVNEYVLIGTKATLLCRWQLDDAETLYSVKWYKDGREFFRYVPRDEQPRNKFVLPGVDVEYSDACASRLVLRAAASSGGRYRCEVSGERPRFHTVSDHRDMHVVVPPANGPKISGFKVSYRLGESVRVNCTSGPSRPQTQLSWYMNGEPLPSERQYPTLAKERLVSSRVSLDIKLERRHFVDDLIKIKCLATISPLYWRSIEEIATLQSNDLEKILPSQPSGVASARGSSPKFLSSNIMTEIIILTILHVL